MKGLRDIKVFQHNQEKADIFLSLTLLLSLLFTTGLGCLGSHSSPAWIHPSYDQYLEVGDTYQATCLLNATQDLFPNATSLDLRIFLNQEAVVDSRISVVNSSAVMLHIEHATIAGGNGRHNVTCKLHDKGICTKYLTVGYKPLEVSNFSCISHNLENLTCTWHEEPNPVETNYTLYYSQYIDPLRIVSYPCPSSTRKPGSCTWTPNTQPIYLTTADKFRFRMKMTNALSSTMPLQNLTIYEHLAILKPGMMENIEVLTVTKASVLLRWKLPISLQSITGDLRFRVSYKPLADWADQAANFVYDVVPDSTEEGQEFLLQGLPHPSVDYEVTISAKTDASDDLWSDPALVKFKTLPDIPCSGPNVTAGSFQIIRSSELLVFWDLVTPSCENGDNFQYQVSLVLGGSEVRSEKVTKQMSSVNLGVINRQYEYHITLQSVNAVGFSNSSYIQVPAANQMPSRPVEVVSLRHSPQDLEVVWSHGPRTVRLPPVNYTIFWCVGTLSGLCVGKLHWTILKEKTTSYNISLANAESDKDVLVFVASVDGTSSSGMQSACAISSNGEIDQMNGVRVDKLENNSLTIRWDRVDCTNRTGIILGYQITVTAGTSNDLVYNDTVDNTAYTYEASGLEPYTDYTISVAVVSRQGIGQSSVVTSRTKSAPPKPPRNLTVSEVTNTSLLLHWMPPEETYGELKDYAIYYDEELEPITVNLTLLKVTGLISYTMYNVSVAARNQEYTSDRSQVKELTTLIGVPGPIANLMINISDWTAYLSWTAPSEKAGPYPVYQVRVSNRDANGFTDPDSTNNTQVAWNLSYCDKEVTFQVRAVNINEQDERLYADWISKTVTCPSIIGWEVWLGFVFTAIAVLIAVFALFFFHWRWRTTKKAKNQEPALPWESRSVGTSYPVKISRKASLAISQADYNIPYDRLISLSSTSSDATNNAVFPTLKTPMCEQQVLQNSEEIDLGTNKKFIELFPCSDIVSKGIVPEGTCLQNPELQPYVHLGRNTGAPTSGYVTVGLREECQTCTCGSSLSLTSLESLENLTPQFDLCVQLNGFGLSVEGVLEPVWPNNY